MKGIRWRIAQFFEIWWWRFYLQQKDPAAYLAWKKSYWKQFLEQSELAPRPGDSILDAGCGPAGIFTIFDHLQPVAIDPLLKNYEKKLPHFYRENWPGTQFHCIDIESFDPQSQFDIIFCLNAINHVQDLNRSLDNLTALLKPGGSLALSIDAHNFQLAKKVMRIIPGDILHPHQYDLQEYKKMLTARGLTVSKEVLIRKNLLFDYWLIVATRW